MSTYRVSYIYDTVSENAVSQMESFAIFKQIDECKWKFRAWNGVRFEQNGIYPNKSCDNWQF